MAVSSVGATRHRSNPCSPVELLEMRTLLSAAITETSLPSTNLASPYVRRMENLGRGVIATRSGTSQVFISWRLLGTDPSGIGFNLYRSANGGAATKLNGSALTAGTNYTDTTANLSLANAYFVKPVIGGVEQASSDAYTLPASTPNQPLFSIPLRNISGTASDYYVHLSWVGDLDGDGEYDFVVDRIPNIANASDKVEAYKRDGTFLWSVDMGPNSLNKNNIEPGSSTLSVGNWDGVTVADLDGDGKAEVMIRGANGVVFGDGTTLNYPANNNVQFISVLNGMTGAERARITVPTDYLTDGPMAASMGVGYLNGVTPSLVVKMKNRIGSGAFNMMMLAYDFDGTNITQKWKWKRGNTNAPDGHQIRIIDVDQDGKDEVVDIGFVLNGDGTMKYSLGPAGIIHGDRFHIGDLDPDRPGLEGYGVQQDNPSLLIEYYYDAATGEILHRHFATAVADNGRGIVGDVDPAQRGYEYWSFWGMYNSKTPVAGQAPVETQVSSEPDRPWPNFRIWWDGDLLSENLNSTKVEKFNSVTKGVSRLLSAHSSAYGATDSWREAPTFYGDIYGDWREEIIYEKFDHSALLIFTTQTATTSRIYTLAQDPAYRNSLTIKGYMQSHNLDYYLGDGMTTPANPSISLAGAAETPGTLAAAALGASKISLNWGDGGTHETGFEIQMAVVTGGTLVFNTIGNAAANATTFTASGLSSSTQYAFRVRAIGQGPDSVYGNSVNATTSATDGSISGAVYIDANTNGVFDLGESAQIGVTVYLDANNNSVSDSGESMVVTSGAGTYTFNGLLAGNYVVRQILPAGHIAISTPGTVAVPVGTAVTGKNFANFPTAFIGTSGNEQYGVRANGAKTEILINNVPTYSITRSLLPNLSFLGSGGNDSLKVDYSAGDPTPSGGIGFDGGQNSDTLEIAGAGNADAFALDAAGLIAHGGLNVIYGGTEMLNLATGNFAVNVDLAGLALQVSGGLAAFGRTQHLASLAVTNSAAVNSSSTDTTSPAMVVGPVTINNATLTIAPNGNLSGVSQFSALTITGNGKLNLRNNDLIIDYGAGAAPLAQTVGYVKTGVVGLGGAGTSGITSTELNTPGMANGASLAVVDVLNSVAATSNYAIPHPATSVLVKFTWVGDANVDGKVDGTDYSLTDTGFASVGNNWKVGDFNYNLSVDSTDYALIDTGFASQTGVIL